MVSFVKMEIFLNEIEKKCQIIFMTFMPKMSHKKSLSNLIFKTYAFSPKSFRFRQKYAYSPRMLE